ncbi:MAG: MoxR family ATPase [Isosphaeraceae bacterium]|nr:MoxR family ATPase [Isosphaeraceae bacterium]
MSQTPAEPKLKPPPAIDCRKSIELTSAENRPEQYHKFEPEHAAAIRAALGAKRPLLVRGKPGVGKTQLAEAAAKVLKRPLLRRVVDSRTEARDLLWEFDAVMRLAEAQITAALATVLDSGTKDESHPLEECTSAARDVSRRLRKRLAVRRFLKPGPLWWAFDWASAQKQARLSGVPEPERDEDANPAHGCVVLIDEIDKADTDVPNGLLEALGSGSFTPLGSKTAVKVQGEPPLVVITTNEERVLPNAFVRRCLVLRMSLPEEDEELIKFLEARAKIHFPKHAKSGKYEELFHAAAVMLVRDRAAARRQLAEPWPGQAEYLDLLRAVLHIKPDSVQTHSAVLESVAAFALRKYEKS